MEASGGMFGEPVAPVRLPEQQAAGIRGDLATLKISDDFLVKKACKDESVLAEWFPGVS